MNFLTKLVSLHNDFGSNNIGVQQESTSQIKFKLRFIVILYIKLDNNHILPNSIKTFSECFKDLNFYLNNNKIADQGMKSLSEGIAFLTPLTILTLDISLNSF